MTKSLLRRLLELRAAIPATDEGLPVFLDGRYYTSSNGKANAGTVENEDCYLAGPFDTGSESSKSYTIGGIENGAGGLSMYVRYFNDLEATSVDNWVIKPRTMNSPGRYIIFSIYKPAEDDMYLYDNTNSRYIFKGKNVT